MNGAGRRALYGVLRELEAGAEGGAAIADHWMLADASTVNRTLRTARDQGLTEALGTSGFRKVWRITPGGERWLAAMRELLASERAARLALRGLS